MGFMVKKKYFKILQNVIEFLGWYESIFLTQHSDLIFFLWLFAHTRVQPKNYNYTPHFKLPFGCHENHTDL